MLLNKVMYVVLLWTALHCRRSCLISKQWLIRDQSTPMNTEQLCALECVMSLSERSTQRSTRDRGEERQKPRTRTVQKSTWTKRTERTEREHRVSGAHAPSPPRRGTSRASRPDRCRRQGRPRPCQSRSLRRGRARARSRGRAGHGVRTACRNHRSHCHFHCRRHSSSCRRCRSETRTGTSVSCRRAVNAVREEYEREMWGCAVSGRDCFNLLL